MKKNNVKEIRELLGLTQEEIATKANISRPFLSDIENGKKVPTINVAFSIARALNRKIGEIFFDINVNHGELESNNKAS